MKSTVCYLLLMFCPIALAQTKPPLETSYDQTKDLTSVSSGDASIDDTLNSGNPTHLYISMNYACPGKTTHCVPKDVEFKATDDAGTGYDKSHDLSFVADGKNIPTIATEYSYDMSIDSIVVNQIDTHIPIDVFRQIAQAKALEGKLGLTTFKLDAKTIAKLRSLMNEIQLGAK